MADRIYGAFVKQFSDFSVSSSIKATSSVVFPATASHSLALLDSRSETTAKMRTSPGLLDALGTFGKSDARQNAACKIQAAFHGKQVREQVRIRTISSGVIHTGIRGDAALLSRMGVPNISTPGPKSIDVVSLDPNRFSSRLVGGDKIRSLKKMTGKEAIRQLIEGPAANADAHVLINGGYFNLAHKADRDAPEHATIGRSVVQGRNVPESLPIPDGYTADFSVITLDDGSSLEVGPTLWNGNESFQESKLDDEKYQWKDEGFRPGMLRHAQHPNTRSGIVFPEPRAASAPASESEPTGKQDRVRMFVASNTTGKRGTEQNGLNLAEAGALAKKLASMNREPSGQAVNLDGGGSSQLAVIEKATPNFRPVRLAVSQPGLLKPVAANFIAFSKKT